MPVLLVPPRRCRRRMASRVIRAGSAIGEGKERSGRAFAMPLMRSMGVVEPFVLSKRVEQMFLIPGHVRSSSSRRQVCTDRL
jgi:hypothetical protein